MRTLKDKLSNLLQKAKKDLSVWLYYANSSSIEEFYEKADKIKQESFHKYDDVTRQVTYIEKLEAKYKETK